MRVLLSKALEKAHKYCLVTNSLNAEVFYYKEIIVDEAATRAETGLPFMEASKIKTHYK